MAKVLVTGGAGFIGSNVCALFKQAGYEVTAFDNLYLGRESNLEEGVKFIKGDINSDEDLAKLPENYDYIVHLAAASSAPMFESNLVQSCETNMIASIKIFELARKTGVKKVIFASTSSIYGDNIPPLREDQPVSPPNIYAVTKHNMEEIAKVYSDLYDLEIIAFRFMSIYGVHEEHKGKFANLVSQFLWTMYQGKAPVVFGDGTQTRDFTNAIDVARGIKLACEKDKKYGFTVFNIGSDVNYSVRDLVDIINKSLGTNIEARFIPNPLRWTATNQLGDLTKIRTELDYEPSIDLETGLAALVKDLPSDPNLLPDVSHIEEILKK